jgi:hypothetical protein
MTIYDIRFDIDAYLEELAATKRAAFVRCLLVGHDWKEATAPHASQRYGYCLRCGKGRASSAGEPR